MAIGGIAVAAAIVCLIEFGPWKGAKAVAAVPAQPPITAPVTQAETQPAPAPAPAQDAAPQPAPAPKPDTAAKPAPVQQAAKPLQPQPPAPQPEVQQPAPQPVPQQPRPEPAPAAPRQPSRQELMRAHEFVAKLHFRADAINNILLTLQRRQEANGMGLNARFTRPQGLMNTNLEAADQALSQGDIQVSREFSEKAERQIEALEKLLNM